METNLVRRQDKKPERTGKQVVGGAALATPSILPCNDTEGKRLQGENSKEKDRGKMNSEKWKSDEEGKTSSFIKPLKN